MLREVIDLAGIYAALSHPLTEEQLAAQYRTATERGRRAATGFPRTRAPDLPARGRRPRRREPRRGDPRTPRAAANRRRRHRPPAGPAHPRRLGGRAQPMRTRARARRSLTRLPRRGMAADRSRRRDRDHHGATARSRSHHRSSRAPRTPSAGSPERSPTSTTTTRTQPRRSRRPSVGCSPSRYSPRPPCRRAAATPNLTTMRNIRSCRPTGSRSPSTTPTGPGSSSPNDTRPSRSKTRRASPNGRPTAIPASDSRSSSTPGPTRPDTFRRRTPRLPLSPTRWRSGCPNRPSGRSPSRGKQAAGRVRSARATARSA